MWWWWQWRKVREAAIAPDLREKFELYGEDVLAHGIGAGAHSDKGPELNNLVGEKRQQVLEWLRERRDTAEQHENRLETVEKWILVFVFLGVVVEVVNLVSNLVRALGH
jgi:hypothetical protein